MSALELRAARYAALGEPARLSIVERLLLADASPGELRGEAGTGTNLVAHHLRVLEDVGLIRRLPSEGDRRRTYVQLRRDDEEVRALAALLTAGLPRLPLPERVVFVCTANSARSQLAAAAWARESALPATSAGTHPAPRVHPEAVAAAARGGLAVAPSGTRSVADTAFGPADLVVAVCDSAHEELAARARQPRTWLHWSIRDPVREATPRAFDDALVQVRSRVRDLASALQAPRLVSPG
ncbi:MAG: ArsR family transcriptional regulator [Kineosporiaceae bacterium]